MVEICICDDDSIMTGFYSNEIKKTINKLYRECDINKFNSGKSMLEYLENNKFKVDVIFLDIDMPEQDGFEVAERIREKSDDIIIIFLTSMDDMVYDSFRYQPLDFIRKVTFDIKIRETIGMIIDKLDRKEKTVLYSIETENGIVKLNLRELLYVECIQRKPHFYMEENMYISTDKKFSEVVERLDKYGFIQSHRLCIVNLDYIYKIKDIEIELSNGLKVPMSRKNRKIVKDVFLNHIV